MIVEQKLKELGIELKPKKAPDANFLHAKKFGNFITLSGCVPPSYKGVIGRDLTIEDGYAAAREAATILISVLKDELGDLDRVTNIVKLMGLMQCDADFHSQPAVMNGASDLVVEVFGEKGKHARGVLGALSMPGNYAMEIEMIAEFE